MKKLTLTLLCAFSLMGCKPGGNPAAVVYQPPQASSAEALKKFWQVPAFNLLDQGGKPFSAENMRGKVWVVDFFYSSCPGPCPMLTSRLSSLHKALKSEPAVGFLSISTDPERDSPAVLSHYADKFEADERWRFLTGEKDVIYRLANDGFKLSLKELPGEKDPISHSTRLVLVDAHGWVRGFYEGVGDEAPQAAERLIQDIHAVMKE